MAKLYIVATPIGNLEDITLRALRVLKEVDVILCEDTRVTRKLMQKYEIETPLLSYHSHSTSLKVKKIFNLLEKDSDLALVSDAGTPTISDPGSLLISQMRERFGGALEIIVIPGPSAVTAALSIAGLSASEFLFLGFLPHKKGRETLFKEIEMSKRTVVFYESPHRLLKTLESLSRALDQNRSVVVARELTKLYEELFLGSAGDALMYFKENPDKVRGELVIMIGTARNKKF